MAQPATGAFVSVPVPHLVVAATPSRMRLGFEYEPGVIAAGTPGAAHAARFAALTGVAEFSVPQLLATAALRHFGAPYGPAVAIAKETALWWMWCGVSPGGKGCGPTGTLMVPQAQNAGRLADFAASLGEAVALDLAISLFNVPYPLWTRIPETDPQGMDFLGPGPQGDIAVEAKAALGSGVARRKKEITKQKARRVAAEKHGIVTCYAMHKRKLTRKGSYVKVVDPPGDENAPRRSPMQALREHYLQVATVLGLDALTALLEPLLEVPTSVTMRPRQALNMLTDDRAAGARVRIGEEVYLGRFFDVDQIIARGKGLDVPARAPRHVVFMGLARSVCLAVISQDEGAAEALLEALRRPELTFDALRDGELGPVQYVGLGDGTLRIDLTSLDQVTYEPLDLDAAPGAR